MPAQAANVQKTQRVVSVVTAAWHVLPCQLAAQQQEITVQRVQQKATSHRTSSRPHCCRSVSETHGRQLSRYADSSRFGTHGRLPSPALMPRLSAACPLTACRQHDTSCAGTCLQTAAASVGSPSKNTRQTLWSLACDGATQQSEAQLADAERGSACDDRQPHADNNCSPSTSSAYTTLRDLKWACSCDCTAAASAASSSSTWEQQHMRSRCNTVVTRAGSSSRRLPRHAVHLSESLKLQFTNLPSLFPSDQEQ